MLTKLRLKLASFILPKGYEAIHYLKLEQATTRCAFQGSLSILTRLKTMADDNYGEDWRGLVYDYISKETEYYLAVMKDVEEIYKKLTKQQ